VALDAVTGEIEAFLVEIAEVGLLKVERAALVEALADVRAMVSTLAEWQRAAKDNPTEVYKVGQIAGC
jgi:hypothetical protein